MLMTIWHREYTLDDVKKMCIGTMVEHVGIEFTDIGDDFLRAKMPVDHRTIQPAGLLHGGASVALAETLGSIAANLVVDRAKRSCVGLEINANHIRSVHSGWVYGSTRPIHIGRSSQVWEIRIADEWDRLVCVSRITMAVLEHK
jgi:1,4-dihydroxy-2-naphthoyl-CoA hydrolase